MLLAHFLKIIKKINKLILYIFAIIFISIVVLLVGLVLLLIGLTKYQYLVYIGLTLSLLLAIILFFITKYKERKMNYLSKQELCVKERYLAKRCNQIELYPIKTYGTGKNQIFHLNDGRIVSINQIKTITDGKVILHSECDVEKDEVVKLLYVFSDFICLIKKNSGETGLISADNLYIKG